MTRYLAILMLFLGLTAVAFTAPPVVFFTDITSGPATGGEGGAGAFVAIYGEGFTATPTVTVGGVLATIKQAPTQMFPINWYQKMVIQVPATAPSGSAPIIVSNASGAAPAIPFTVRSGTIRFVGTQPGDQSSIVACKNAMAAGDICYVRNGVTQSAQEALGASLVLNAMAPITTPRAIIGYPGATATIGSTSIGRAIHSCTGESACNGGASGWVIANLTLKSTDTSLHEAGPGTVNMRYIDLKIDSPPGTGQSGAVEFEGGANNTIFYGLDVTGGEADTSGAFKQYHGIYLSSCSSHADVGWNYIHGTGSAGSLCWAFQVNSSPGAACSGADQFDFLVHDNKMTNTRCGGINFASVNPGNGPVKAFNNVIWHVGTGGGDTNNSACMQVGSFDGATVPVEVYNNTFTDCSVAGSSPTNDNGFFNINGNPTPARLRNNVFKQVGPSPFMSGSTVSSGGNTLIQGDHNIWVGANDVPTAQTNVIRLDPQFVAPGPLVTSDFHLQSTSPAIGAGTGTLFSLFDHDGLSRGNPPSLGAYEFSAGQNQTPLPPTNLVVTVQ